MYHMNYVHRYHYFKDYTESIVDGIVTEPDEIKESLAIVLDESKRLNRLVNELLKSARMDAKGDPVNKEVQPIAALLDKMKIKYRQQADDLGLNMTFNDCKSVFGVMIWIAWTKYERT